MLDIWNLAADCKLLILHFEISLTNLEPLQPYFICLNCICSVITITITIPITIPITLTTISTPEALIDLLLAFFASSPAPKWSQFTTSLHKAVSQPSPQLETVVKFKNLRIHCDWFTGRHNRFASSSKSRLCKGIGVCAVLALHLRVYSTSRADPFWTFADMLQFTRWLAQLTFIVKYIKMVQDCWDTSIISSRFAAQLLLQSPGQTPFELFQIDSNWLAAKISRLGSSSISRWCRDAGIHRLLALDSLLYCFSSLQCRPLWNFSRST